MIYMLYEIYWVDNEDELIFVVEEHNEGNKIHWVTHPFLVGQLVSKNPDEIVAKASSGKPLTGRQVLNMFINVPHHTFDSIAPNY